MNRVGQSRVDTFAFVDVLKLFFALCVVCIHCEIFWGTAIGAYIYPLLFRIAVPFFMVASGFFFGKKLFKITAEGGTGGGLVKQYCIRLLQKLVVFEAIHILLQAAYALYRKVPIGEFLVETIKTVIFYPGGALWYIQAVIIAILLLYAICKQHKEQWILPVGILLYLFGCLGNRYYFVIEETSVQTAIDTYLRLCLSMRNGLFYGFIFVGMGMLIAKNFMRVGGIITDKVKKKRLALTGITFALLVCEAWWLIPYNGADDNSMHIMHLAFVPLLFMSAISIRLNYKGNTVLLRNLSTSIYLLHRPILFVVGLGYLFVSGNVLLPGYSALIVLSVIAVICAVVYKLKPKYIYQILV